MGEETVQPTVGRLVHYKLAEGVIRPAIIVHVWGPDCVQLQVFLDGTNDSAHVTGDEAYRGLKWAMSVVKNTEAEGEGTFDIETWDWMPFQKDQQARLAKQETETDPTA